MTNILYTTQGSASGGRTGHAQTSDGRLKVTLDTPQELGGGGGAGTNPEQLFACAYAACFLGAMKFVAGNDKIALTDDTTVTATVGVGPRDDGQGFGLSIALSVAVPGLDRAAAERLIQKAHVVCPYSDLARGNVEVALALA